MSAQVQPENVLAFHQISFDLDTNTAEVDGVRLNTTPMALRLLRFLMLQPFGTTVTQRMIMDHPYPTEPAQDHQTPDVLICALRQALGGERDYIKSVWGRGYVLQNPQIQALTRPRRSLPARHPNAKPRLPQVVMLPGPNHVFLPDGSTLTRADLPEPTTYRWVSRRKVLVVRAIIHGLITVEEAARMYPSLTLAEVGEWVASFRDAGQSGLKVTHIHVRRSASQTAATL